MQTMQVAFYWIFKGNVVLPITFSKLELLFLRNLLTLHQSLTLLRIITKLNRLNNKILED
jgi:hypothetical protein